MKQETPEAIKPYKFLGINITGKEGNKQLLCTCPWCDKDNKFTINIENGLWSCRSCKEGYGAKGGGNITTFIRLLLEHSKSLTTKSSRKVLGKSVGVKSLTIKKFGIVKSLLDNRWILPGYNAEQQITSVYQYRKDRDAGKMRWMPTATLGLKLAGLFPIGSKPNILLCEGIHDAMAIYQIMEDRLSDFSIIAVPGSGNFFETWRPLFSNKTVYIAFDNDHPKRNKKLKKDIAPAGLSGVKRTTSILLQGTNPPKDVHYLKWGKDSFNDLTGYNKKLKSGYDLRDFINDAASKGRT